MSWHTTAVLIQGRVPEDPVELIQSLGLEPGDLIGECTFDEASSSMNEGIAVGIAGDWTALFSNMAFLMVDEKNLAAMSRNGRLMQLILEGASDTAGFSWWVGGKKERDWLRQEGELHKNEGITLPEERAAFEGNDDEQAVLALLESLTLPIAKLEAVTFKQYEVNLEDLIESMSE